MRVFFGIVFVLAIVLFYARQNIRRYFLKRSLPMTQQLLLGQLQAASRELKRMERDFLDKKMMVCIKDGASDGECSSRDRQSDRRWLELEAQRRRVSKYRQACLDAKITRGVITKFTDPQ